MKTTKTVFHIFDASAFDEELGLLDEMSEKGWQLKDMNLLNQKYVWDDSVLYRYAIDYQHELTMGEFHQYRAEFEDQGWAYVTKYSDWYVFRKPYDPALPDNEYLLYTDEPSFRDMKRSIGLKINFFACFMLSQLFIESPSMPVIMEAAAILLVGINSFLRRRSLLHVCCIPKKYRFHLWRYAFVPVILLFVLAFVFIGARSSMGVVRTPRPLVDAQSVDFTVRLPDVYGIWVEDHGSDASEVPYIITNGDGRVISSGVLSVSDNERINQFFWPGTYTLTVDGGQGQDLERCSAVIGSPRPLLNIPLWADFVWVIAWGALFFILGIISEHKNGHRAWI